CDRLFMINKGKRVIYGHINDVKAQYANFKCTIYGNKNKDLLDHIPQVERVEFDTQRSILYLKNDGNLNNWLKELTENLDIQELSIDRVSLHEIFIDIATGHKNKEAMSDDTYNESM